jgi:hypothetical protein
VRGTTNWLHAGWNRFLKDRALLYDLDRVCRRYPGAGTPTQFLGLDRQFSDAVCAVVDMGIAQYGEWVDDRREQTVKVGKSLRKRYDRMADLLGITEEQNRGGMDGADLTAASKDYALALAKARATGGPPPTPPGVDPAEWEQLQQVRPQQRTPDHGGTA